MSATVAQPASTSKERWGWYLYDFGNSAYVAVVVLAVYSAYFQDAVVGGPEGTRLWGIAVSIAMLIVAVISPVLGTLADFSGAKKRFLAVFTGVAVIGTGLLFFVEAGDIFIGMLFYIVAETGYRAAQVYYNGLLPEIARPEEMGRISGNGWAVGSAGGIICLLVVLPLIVSFEGTFIIRISMVITAVFFGLSTLPIFLWVKERAQPQVLPAGESYFMIGFKRIWRTLKKARQYREFLKFMLSFIIYNDGIIMALEFAAIIGAVLFGMEQEQLIIFIIMVQVFSIVGAYLFGIMTDRSSGKQALIVSLIMMIAAVVWLYFAQSVTAFYIIGAIAGFSLTGVQSVSRTMVGKLSPPGQSAEFFGLFAVFGRTSSFIGPFVYGFIAAEVALALAAQGQTDMMAEQAGQRWAILSIAAFLVIGLIFLLNVNEEKGMEEAQAG